MARSPRWSSRISPTLRVELVNLLMRQLEKLVEQSQLVHHFQSRRMNRIAAKIAQEIAVLFQHQDFDAGARQQIARASCRPVRRPRCSSARKFSQVSWFEFNERSRLIKKDGVRELVPRTRSPMLKSTAKWMRCKAYV